MALDDAKRPWMAVDVPGAGRGLRATRDIVPQECLLSVPISRCWPTADAARSTIQPFASSAGCDFSDEGVLAVWLLSEISRGEKSPISGELAALPRELNTVLQWTDDEAMELRGSCFDNVVQGLRSEIADEWAAISTESEWAEWLSIHQGLNMETFSWAKAICLSRQYEHDWNGHLPEGSKVIIPDVDLLNHDFSPNCCVEVTDDVVQVRATQCVSAGRELRIAYGPLPNASLFISYGFTLEHNIYDCVELVLSFAIPGKRRRSLLRGIEAVAMESSAEGLSPFEVVLDPSEESEDPSAEFVMRHNLTQAVPLPATFLAAVRIQSLSDAELGSVEARLDGPAAAAGLHGIGCAPWSLLVPGEAAAMRRTAGILRSLLDGHPVPLAQDVSALAAMGVLDPDAGLSAARLRMATAVRVAEKQILTAAIDALEVANLSQQSS